MREMLPLYQAITTVELGDGKSTAFWHDVWTGEESIAERFPALYSHCMLPNQPVHLIVAEGLRCHLVPRLTAEAILELATVNELLSRVVLTDNRDGRNSAFARENGTLHTSGLYKMIKSAETHLIPARGPFWRSCAPPRVQFFAWLLMHGRLKSKSNLFRKKIVADPTCDLCHSSPETAEHPIFQCPFAASFWLHLGFSICPDASICDLRSLGRPASLPSAHFDTFVLLCCWQLWKRRNGIVFCQEDMPLAHLLQMCKLEARAWSCRLPRDDVVVSDQWCSVFSLAI